jgi:phospholipid-transporting ATPase
LETAISIGRSCNLVLTDTRLVYLTNIDTASEFATRLQDVYRQIETDNVKNTALVMDGPSFQHFDDKDLAQRSKLLKIGQSCRSVIACRLTPTQKREVVRLVKKDSIPRSTTLSIGDGANDVSMILEGNVGVGIYGKEGRQAANNADFAIGEFKFLRRLLLVHGRWNYVRQSQVFLYSMHKNMVITLTLFWFRWVVLLSIYMWFLLSLTSCFQQLLHCSLWYIIV